MSDKIIKTLIIKKKARKYFDCIIGGYKAKLVINDISRDLAEDTVVQLEVLDLSERTKYGTTLKFEPVAVITERDAAPLREAASARREAEKWLGYAESDVRDGRYSSNAIATAQRLCKTQEHLAERCAAMQAKADSNHQAHQEAIRQREAQRQAEQAKAAERRSRRILFPMVNVPAMGEVMRWGKRVLVFTEVGKTFCIGEDHPSFEGAHLLGHEGDWGCYCYYREATGQEVAELEAAEASAKAEREAEQAKARRLDEIKGQIMAGELPEGQHQPEGERLLDTQTIYGGGDWFVITVSHIWYVKNNGADGDAWSRNNIITGGAGAIGWRIPLDPALADELRNLN